MMRVYAPLRLMRANPIRQHHPFYRNCASVTASPWRHPMSWSLSGRQFHCISRALAASSSDHRTKPQPGPKGLLYKPDNLGKPWTPPILLQRALPAMFDDALSNGTLSWDAIINRALTLSLYSCLSSVAGVSIPSFMSMCFGDVRLRVMERSHRDDSIRFTAQFTLRVPGKTETIDIHDLGDEALCTCDPIKLLLIHALRTGATEVTTLDELLAGAKGISCEDVNLKFPGRHLIYLLNGDIRAPNHHASGVNAYKFMKNHLNNTTRGLGLRLSDVDAGMSNRNRICSDPEHLPTPSRPELSLPSLEFISKFSAINEMRASRKETFEKAAIGGSRDMPTRFMLRCPNSEHGCSASFPAANSVKRHLKLCRSGSKEAHRKVLQEDAYLVFGCPECGLRFRDEAKRQVHLKKYHHNWKPQACPEPGCCPGHIFDRRRTLMSHILDKHTRWIPSKCPICATYEYTDSGSLRKHLRLYHPELDKEGRSALYTNIRHKAIATRRREGKPTTFRIEDNKIVY